MATNYLTRSPGTPTSEKIATIRDGIRVNNEKMETYLKLVWYPVFFFLPVL